MMLKGVAAGRRVAVSFVPELNTNVASVPTTRVMMSLMPRSVKIFWWLAVVIVVYWIIVTALFLLWPPVHYTNTLAHIPGQLRIAARRADTINWLIKASFWSISTLCLAWLGLLPFVD